MKKLLTIIGLVAGATLLHAQGIVDFTGGSAGITTNSALFTVNGGETSTAPFGKTGSQTSGQLYYYVLLYSTTAITGSSAPTNTEWTLAAPQAGGSLIGTNSILAGSMSGNNGGGGVTLNNMAAGTAYFVELVGWSSGLGSDWNTVSGLLTSSLSNGGIWNAAAGNFFGYTSVGTMTPGSTPGGAGDPTVFTGSFANNSMVLYAVPVPEPTTLALAGLGGMALLAFRRKKA